MATTSFTSVRREAGRVAASRCRTPRIMIDTPPQPLYTRGDIPSCTLFLESWGTDFTR